MSSKNFSAGEHFEKLNIKKTLTTLVVSVIFFPFYPKSLHFTRRNEEDIIQHPKRLREETPATPSEILIEGPSTATLVEETVNINPNLLTTQNHNEKTSNYLVIQLNRLKNKEARFESHKDFLTRCINECLVPKGLELMLEPTIGSHEQIF